MLLVTPGAEALVVAVHVMDTGTSSFAPGMNHSFSNSGLFQFVGCERRASQKAVTAAIIAEAGMFSIAFLGPGQ